MSTRKADTTPCINPLDGTLIGYAPLHGAEDVMRAMETARREQPGWAARSVRERVRFIRRIADHLVSETDRIVDTICRDNGKSSLDALIAEVLAAIVSVRYYCRKAPEFLAETGAGAGSIALFFKRTRIVPV